MTPVIVFLTDKTLYVTDLIRNRLFNKFVLPYTELDVILVRKTVVQAVRFAEFISPPSTAFHRTILFLNHFTTTTNCG